jgi:hypothetical protein
MEDSSTNFMLPRYAFMITALILSLSVTGHNICGNACDSARRCSMLSREHIIVLSEVCGLLPANGGAVVS